MQSLRPDRAVLPLQFTSDLGWPRSRPCSCHQSDRAFLSVSFPVIQHSQRGMTFGRGLFSASRGYAVDMPLDPPERGASVLRSGIRSRIAVLQ